MNWDVNEQPTEKIGRPPVFFFLSFFFLPYSILPTLVTFIILGGCFQLREM